MIKRIGFVLASLFLFATSVSAQTPVSGGGIAIPPVQDCNGACLNNAQVTYRSNGSTFQNISVYPFTNVFGRTSTTSPIQSWPGYDGADTIIDNFPNDHFLSMVFTVPVNVDPRLIETLVYDATKNIPGFQISARVTPLRGGKPLGSRCIVTRIPGQTFFHVVVAPYTNGCQVEPGHTYYLEYHLISDITKPTIPVAISQFLTRQPPVPTTVIKK